MMQFLLMVIFTLCIHEYNVVDGVYGERFIRYSSSNSTKNITNYVIGW